MTQILHATYDGHVFTPEERIDLQPDKRYLLRVEIEGEKSSKEKKLVLQRLSTQAQNLGVSDLAEQHDHYLYGTEKR